jgi:polar amino acid transport system substrate-binding protein
MRATTLAGLTLSLLVVTLAACDGDSTGDGEAAGADLALVTDGTLTICSDVPHGSFAYEDAAASSGYRGFDIDLAQAVADDFGLGFEVHETDFDRIADASAMAEGDCDLGVSAIPITDAWSAALDFGDPYYDVRHGLFVLAGSELAALEDAAGLRLGVQTGTAGPDLAAEHAPPGTEIVEFGTPGDLVAALVSGDVDAALQDLAVDAGWSDSAASVEMIETFATGERYGFAVEAGREDGLLAEVQGALDRLAEAGTVDELHDRYFGT